MPLPPAPNRITRPDTIDDDADAFFGYLPTYDAELRAQAANVGKEAMGGAYALEYRYTGNSGLFGAPTGTWMYIPAILNQIQFDTRDNSGALVSATLAKIGSGTSAIKSVIRITAKGDKSRWMIFALTAYSVGGSGYYGGFDATLVDRSSANPFVEGEPVLVHATPVGDKGDAGSAGNFALVASATLSSPAVFLDFLNVFTSAYDKYVIELENYAPDVTGNNLSLRLATGGAPYASASYIGPAYAGGTSSVTPISILLGNGANTVLNVGQAGMTIEVRNANGANRKNVTVRGSYVAASSTLVAVAGEWDLGVVAPLTGFRLYWTATANFQAGTIVRVFGVKNT